MDDLKIKKMQASYKDTENIWECDKCGKKYGDTWLRNDSKEDRKRRCLHICRECFIEVEANPHPIFVLLWKLDAKLDELHSVDWELDTAYRNLLKQIRTPEKIALDEAREKRRAEGKEMGYTFSDLAGDQEIQNDPSLGM